ncbi:alpha/beta fold hydrolase [Brachybacterium aquaticum]|uniref:Pimeloyl-ACP methyl ester carboxylesterase n=1 Tax=Brachybacterium aquaticum TaxID=1432564 RepID=A0A841AF64_9MICO|nr:alpha/beta hydrolase [Brachybacterium aquaticum]MBB5831718.1 pimeloyl-ACP methyl ester carboxylesterase [Brachybacterium aquaticum]
MTGNAVIEGRAAGAPSRPWPVVLVHGTRTSHSQWDPQVPSLRAAGHLVVTPDLPGHGSRREEPFTLEAAVAAIEDAVREASERAGYPAHLVGSSLGGMLAIHAAARLSSDAHHLGVPSPLGSLVACGAAVQPTPLTARLYAALIGATDLLPSMRTGQGSFPFTWLLGEDGARAYLRGGRADISVVAPAFADVAFLDLRADLARIGEPVTFLHGRAEQLRLHERSFVAAAPRGRLELLPYGNHMVNLAQAHRFTADLLRVLARAQRESAAASAQRESAAPSAEAPAGL